MSLKSQANDKQVAEVRRILEGILKPNNREWLRFDGRIGYALSKKYVTQSVGGGWGSTVHYDFATTPDGRLRDKAREWIEANGMKDLADAYDARVLRRYVNTNVESLNKRREKLLAEVATLDAQIAQYEALLKPPVPTEETS